MGLKTDNVCRDKVAGSHSFLIKVCEKMKAFLNTEWILWIKKKQK